MGRDQKWNSCEGLTQKGWRLSGCKLLNGKSDVGVVPSAERGKEMDMLRWVKCALTLSCPVLKGN